MQSPVKEVNMNMKGKDNRCAVDLDNDKGGELMKE